jgi:hypothetical protein
MKFRKGHMGFCTSLIMIKLTVISEIEQIKCDVRTSLTLMAEYLQ